MHIPPTSVDRTVTNEDVKRILQDQQGLKVADFSDMWIHKKIKLLGHIIRSHNQDPMKQVLFEPYTLTPRIEHARRVGKPRAHWLIETYADAYKAAGMLEQFDMENIQHRNVIHDMAMQRTGIFQWDRLLYIYFYLFTHVTESFVTERLVTESWGLLLAPPPYFSVSCLKRFPDTPRIYTMVLQGLISIVSLSPLLSNLHRRILRSAIIACALQKKNSVQSLWLPGSDTTFAGKHWSLFSAFYSFVHRLERSVRW